MSSRLRHPLVAVAGAFALTAPWVGAELFGVTHALSVLMVVLVSGLAVLGASFLLAWGAETAEKDVPRAFAIAVLAVLAVAPEYAVDALYAWGAGAGGATAEACAALPPGAVESPDPGTLAEACHDANLAVANMTGANRILIGLGWAGIALYTIYRVSTYADANVVRKDGIWADQVQIDRDLALEITFLLAATFVAFFVPLSGGIGVMDTLVLVGIYALYIAIIIKGPVEEVEQQVGVPAYFHGFPQLVRAVVSIGLFLFSGVMIYTAVHPFAHGLEELGTALGVPAFFMIQWIAPLASESPELIVVVYLVNKARSTAGFNALISSKLNQWTLLIGTLAVVYSIAGGRVGSLPFDATQSAEIWITAAQSLFAIAILINFNISAREAVALFVLFISQVIVEFLMIREVIDIGVGKHTVLLAYTAVYVVLGMALFVQRRDALAWILRRTKRVTVAAFTDGSGHPDHAD